MKKFGLIVVSNVCLYYLTISVTRTEREMNFGPLWGVRERFWKLFGNFVKNSTFSLKVWSLEFSAGILETTMCIK